LALEEKMAETASGAKSDLLARIDQSWSVLDALITRLDEARLTSPRDPAGWAVKDHLIHIAAWEDSVSALFQGRPRHQGLGVDKATYESGPFDEVNRRIYEKHSDVSAASAIERLRASHQILMAFVEGISEADLTRAVGEVFPSLAPGDRSTVLETIDGNTAGHYEEHMGWIEALLGGS
jgi:hypothetical protein